MEFLVILVVLVLFSPVLAILALARLGGLARRVGDLESELSRLRWERPQPATPSPRPAPGPGPGITPPAPSPVRPSPPPDATAPVAPAAPIAPAVPAARPAVPAGAGPPPPRDQPPPSLELIIGTRWLNVAGIVTLLFGVAFFLKYAYENAWIGPRGRVAIGLASGIAAILVGEAARRRGHRIFSQGLTGGGIAALYLSFFFSFRLYHLVEVVPAFVLMAAVTAGGVALALLADSMAVAILAFLGGYLTPVLLSTGQDSAEFLFGYLTLLALGALATTYFRRWRSLDILAFAGTFLLYAGWFSSHYTRERLGVAVTGLCVFFLVFLLVPYGHTLARRLVAGPEEHLLALANAAVTFGYLYRMIHPISPRGLGFVALALSAGYLGLGTLARRRVPGDRRLTVTILGICIAFLTLAVPLQMGLHGITLVWGVQGLVIVWLGFRYETRLTRLAGLAVTGLALIRLLARHTPLHTEPFTLMMNPSFGTWLAVAACVLGAAAIYRAHRGAFEEPEAPVIPATLVIGCLVVLAALTMETRLDGVLRDRPATHVEGVTVLVWALFPFAVLAAGRMLGEESLVHLATWLTALSAVTLLLLAGAMSTSFRPLLTSFPFLTGALGTGGLFAMAWWRRGHGPPSFGEVPAPLLLLGEGGALLLILLTVELHAHYRLEPGAPERMATNGLRALLAVSVVWAVYAAALMAIGFARSSRACRYAAGALFAATLGKVFLMDMAGLRNVYRIVSFLILGLLLVAASFLYSRFRARVATLVIAGAALAAAGGGPALAAFEPAAWSRMREIDVTAITGRGEPLARLVLDPDVLSAARPDLADLRVVGRDGREVPWVLDVRRGGAPIETWTPRLLNRATLPDGAVVVELEFGERTVKNLLEVRTTGADFRRRVRVEGSDDGAAWATLVESAWIHAIPGAGPEVRTRHATVALPDSDHRRLRVSVYPMPEERAGDAVGILGVTARRRRVVEPELAPLKIAHEVTRDPNARTTLVAIDLPHRQARPARLALDIEEEAFRRPVAVQGRIDRVMTVRAGRTETGEPVVRTVEEPWRTLATGTLFRRPAGRPGEAPVDETVVDLPGEAATWLRVVIRDHDNPPLRVRGVTVHSLVHAVVFPVRAGGAYRLYYGNAGAAMPVYDLPGLLPEPVEGRVAVAALGPSQDNPAHPASPELPFSERHPWVLWIALLAAVGVIGLLVLRGLRHPAAGKG